MKSMIPDEELEELKERISQKSDHELLRIIEVEYDDYRPEAIEFAKAELTKRFVPSKSPRYLRSTRMTKRATRLPGRPRTPNLARSAAAQLARGCCSRTRS